MAISRTEAAFVHYGGQACTTYPGESARDTVGVVRPGGEQHDLQLISRASRR